VVHPACPAGLCGCSPALLVCVPPHNSFCPLALPSTPDPWQGWLKVRGIVPRKHALLKVKAALTHRNKASPERASIPWERERDWGCSWHILPVKKKADFKERQRLLQQLEKGESQLLTLQEVRTLLSLLKLLQFKVTSTASHNQRFALTLADLYVCLGESLGGEQHRREERAHVPPGAHCQGGRTGSPSSTGSRWQGSLLGQDLPAVPEAAGAEVDIGAVLLPPPAAAALPATHASPPAG